LCEKETDAVTESVRDIRIRDRRVKKKCWKRRVVRLYKLTVVEKMHARGKRYVWRGKLRAKVCEESPLLAFGELGLEPPMGDGW
jgi:hypothetical protein